jgi:hypothetical protein
MMSASVQELQIANAYNRGRISAFICDETSNLSKKYKVSVLRTQQEDIWELIIERPDGNNVSRDLDLIAGDLVPSVFRIRLRELIKLL